MKTSELIGAALDRAVGMAMQLPASYWNEGKCARFSTDWAHGGPIIQHEGIELYRHRDGVGWVWGAKTAPYYATLRVIGPTPLIAAMRCFVASNLGADVEIPEELA